MNLRFKKLTQILIQAVPVLIFISPIRVAVFLISAICHGLSATFEYITDFCNQSLFNIDKVVKSYYIFTGGDSWEIYKRGHEIVEAEKRQEKLKELGL